MDDEILEIIEKMRPYMNSHGGDIEFIKFEDGIVYVKITGFCSTCPYQSATLQDGLLEALKSEIPEVKELIAVDI